MKKKVLMATITILIACTIGVGCLYAFDMHRMNNNQPVLFSTWGYDYAPPIPYSNPPVLYLNDENGTTKATCLLGSHNWRNGNMEIFSDYPHPIEREYHEENTLNITDSKEIFIHNQNTEIKGVRVYYPNANDPLNLDIPFTENSIIFDLPNNEYIVEIMTEQEYGTVQYSLKVVK